MSLYANGRTTGLVVDSGAGVTHTVPVFEGLSIPHGISMIEVAGGVISSYLTKMLKERGPLLTSRSELYRIVKDIKEKFCFVAQDYDAEHNAA